MIKSIQLQTIDKCNSRCVMCPYKDTPHTHNIISDILFVKIVTDVKICIDKGLISPKLDFALFFQNEPLLDPFLFKRAELIKRVIPTSHLLFYTNGLLLKKRVREVIQSKFDQVYLSLYGQSSDVFNSVTGVNIKQQDLVDMMDATQEIRNIKRFEVLVDPSWDIEQYNSRAGFRNGNKILHDKVDGCHLDMDKRLHILADGRVIVCCQDWLQQEVLGDMTEQNLTDIFKSDKYLDVINKINGRESKKDFICKKCERAKHI